MVSLKKNFKHKLFYWLFTFGFALCIGAFAFAQNSYNTAYAEDEYSEYIELKEPYMVSYNDNTYTIVFSADELNNYIWVNFNNYYYNLYNNNHINIGTTLSYIGYNGSEYNVDDLNASDDGYYEISLTYDNIHYIDFNPNHDYTFRYVDNDDELSFEYDLVLELSSTYYADVKQVIELDISANQSVSDSSMGSVLEDFVEILVNGIVTLGQGIATGVSSMASALFLEVDAGTGAVTGLSMFGGIVAIFAGLALAIAITTRVYVWITSLGN